MITEDMRAVIAAQRLCFAATVTPEGLPNLSPKGTIRIWNENTLFFLDLASPNTRANLMSNPWIELNVVDTVSRRGYRFLGTGSIHAGDEIFQRAVAQITAEEQAHYQAHAVILVRLTRALPLWSPGYDHIAGESGMRMVWKRRRQELDREFEEHIARAGEFMPPR